MAETLTVRLFGDTVKSEQLRLAHVNRLVSDLVSSMENSCLEIDQRFMRFTDGSEIMIKRVFGATTVHIMANAPKPVTRKVRVKIPGKTRESRFERPIPIFEVAGDYSYLASRTLDERNEYMDDGFHYYIEYDNKTIEIKELELISEGGNVSFTSDNDRTISYPTPSPGVDPFLTYVPGTGWTPTSSIDRFESISGETVIGGFIAGLGWDLAGDKAGAFSTPSGSPEETMINYVIPVGYTANHLFVDWVYPFSTSDEDVTPTYDPYAFMNLFTEYYWVVQPDGGSSTQYSRHWPGIGNYQTQSVTVNGTYTTKITLFGETIKSESYTLYHYESKVWTMNHAADSFDGTHTLSRTLSGNSLVLHGECTTDDGDYMFFYGVVDEDHTVSDSWEEDVESLDIELQGDRSSDIYIVINGEEEFLMHAPDSEHTYFIARTCKIYNFGGTPVFVYSWTNLVDNTTHYGFKYGDKYYRTSFALDEGSEYKHDIYNSETDLGAYGVSWLSAGRLIEQEKNIVEFNDVEIEEP